MQAVHEQQAGDRAVGGERGQDVVVQPAQFVQDVEDALDAGAVQVGDDAHEFLGPLAGDRAAGGTGDEQGFNPITRRLKIKRRVIGLLRLDHGYSPVTDCVGECSFCTDLPSPRYMCTPQGRQGSKLRTVRMMSMPLKCSRSFSSKIGWPWTASS